MIEAHHKQAAINVTTLLLQPSDERAAVLVASLERRGCRAHAFATDKAVMDHLARDASAQVIIMDPPKADASPAELLSFLQATHYLRTIPVVTCESIECPAGAESVGLAGGREASILIVDDEDVLLGLLERILSRDGYRVLKARSVAEAKQLLDRHDVGFVLSDIDMPDQSGMVLLAYIKENHHEIPILMMTGNGSRYDRATVLEAGADGYLPKPFKNTGLTALIDLMSGRVAVAADRADPVPCRTMENRMS